MPKTTFTLKEKFPLLSHTGYLDSWDVYITSYSNFQMFTLHCQKSRHNYLLLLNVIFEKNKKKIQILTKVRIRQMHNVKLLLDRD